VAHIGLLFPFAGIAGAVVAIVFAGRFIRAAPPPTKDR
jgi:hypothetical protein